MERVEAIEAVGLEHPASVGDPGREQCASPIRKRRTRIQRVDVDSRTGSGLSVHVEGANDEPVRGLPASSATSRWPYINWPRSRHRARNFTGSGGNGISRGFAFDQQRLPREVSISKQAMQGASRRTQSGVNSERTTR